VHARDEPGRRSEHRDGQPRKPQVAGDPVAQILALQRASGNAAVANMVELARKPREKAASTDAPWAAKPPSSARSGSGSSKAKPPQKKKKHSNRGLTSAESGWDRSTLFGHAMDAMNDKDYEHAAALLERAYELQPARDVAMNVYRAYKALGDDEQADYWIKVSQGVIKPGATEEPPVSYQQF
jgi:hypothetical protein